MSRAADLLEHVGRVGIRNAHARRPDGLHPLVHLLFIFSREHHTLAAGVRKDEGEGPHGLSQGGTDQVSVRADAGQPARMQRARLHLVITRPHVTLVEEHDAIGFVAESEEIAGRLWHAQKRLSVKLTRDCLWQGRGGCGKGSRKYIKTLSRSTNHLLFHLEPVS